MIRIANTGQHDLIIQSNGQGNRRIRPLTIWERLWRNYAEVDIGDNELLVIRTTKAAEPDTGIPLKTPV